jgi:DNA-binding beta-propeller fold protein YncE
MLKKSIILIFFLQLSGCPIQGGEVKPTSLPETPTPNPNSTELPEKYKDYEILSPGILCEPKSTIKTELKYPYKLAVSKDGSTVFVINSICSFSPGFANREMEIKFCQNNPGRLPEDNNPKIRSRNVIYKISKDKNINFIKLNNEPLMSCTLSGEIQTDENNNLYLVDNSQNIYKFTLDNQLIKLINVEEKAKTCADSIYTGCPIPFLAGPINLYQENENLNFIMSKYGESSEAYIKKLNLNTNNLSEIDTGSSAPNTFPFAIYDNKIYIISNNEKLMVFSQPYPKSFWGAPLQGKRLNPLEQVGKSPESITDYVKTIKINSKGEIFINDLYNHSIWKIDSNGNIAKFAGSGKSGLKDGKGEEAEFNYPTGMDFDSQDNLFIADTGNNAIRKITPDRVVTTFYKSE